MSMRFWLAAFLGIVLGIGPGMAARVSDFQAGQTAFQAGKYTDAISRFSNVIATGKADEKVLAKIFYMRGTSYLRLKRLTQAIADFSNAIWLDELPAALQVQAHIRRGKLRLLMSLHEKALKDMNEAVRLAPSAVSYSARAEAYVRLGKYPLAVADLDKALSDKGAVKYHIHFIRALAYEGLGRKADAKANLRKSLVYKPGYAPARQMLAALGGSTKLATRGAGKTGAGALQRPHMLTTGSIRPRQASQKKAGDVAERDWMLATRTIRGGVRALRSPKTKKPTKQKQRLKQTPERRDYVLQLSARKTLETAKIALHHIADVNRDLLAGKDLYVEKANSAELGEIYRVRLGHFAARNEPIKLCAKLKSRGQSCFLTHK